MQKCISRFFVILGLSISFESNWGVYENRILLENDDSPNALYQGTTFRGIEIVMYVDNFDGTIQTAYQLYKRCEHEISILL